MRKPAIILLVLLISVSISLSACTWQEFETKMTDFFNKIDDTVKQKNTTTTASPPEIKKCASDKCVRDAFSECTYAEGEFNDNRSRHAKLRIEPSTLTLGNTEITFCKITYTILTSAKKPEEGKDLECTLPLILLTEPEEMLTLENPFCGGTLFDLLTPQVNYTATGFTIANFTIRGKTVSFFFENNDKTIYLKNAIVIGASFTNCILEYKNPVRINRKEPQTMTLGCTDLQAAGFRASGLFLISYYNNPNSINMTTINGTFVGNVVH